MAAPPRVDLSLLPCIRRVLLDADFSESSILAALGPSDPGVPPDDCLPQWLWRCRGSDPLAVLIRLFVLGQRVSYRHAIGALAPMTVDQWQELGLLRHDHRHVAATVELAAKPGFFVVSDPSFVGLTPAADHVLGVTTSALTLNLSTIRRDGPRSLDLGSGNGFLALHMAAHSEQVAGVDLNERAVAFARFNAALNEVPNVDFRSGDRFAPVSNESFHLIAGNLPFVISPSRDFLYRDGAAEGPTFLQSVLEEAPDRLTDGGFAQFLGQWTDRDEALEAPGCDTWVIRYATDTPDEYASRWVLPGNVIGKRARARQYRQWMRFYESRGIDAIHTGLWNLRRRNGTGHWQVILNRPLPSMTCGDRIEESFRSWGCWQESSNAEEILNLRVSISPYTVLREESQWHGPQAVARLLPSDGYSMPMDANAAVRQTLALADGARTLRDIAASLQITALEPWLQDVKELVLQGYLKIGEAPTDSTL